MLGYATSTRQFNSCALAVVSSVSGSYVLSALRTKEMKLAAAMPIKRGLVIRLLGYATFTRQLSSCIFATIIRVLRVYVLSALNTEETRLAAAQTIERARLERRLGDATSTRWLNSYVIASVKVVLRSLRM